MRFSPNSSTRQEKIQFVCMHWTGGSFAGAVSWCLNPDSLVSYHKIISSTGEVRELVPMERSAWSVGVSRSFDTRLKFRVGNHASYNIAWAGAPHLGPLTEVAYQKGIDEIVKVFHSMRWGPEETWRIKGHHEVAVYKKGHPKAGQLGRKPDPVGSGWTSMEKIRTDVRNRLIAP